MLDSNLTLENKTILLTGAAGFIGASLARRLLASQIPLRLVGIDSMNDYYDVTLKEERLHCIQSNCSDSAEWFFHKGDLVDRSFMDSIFAQYRPSIVINLAAQAGVRYSIANPEAYIQTNLVGFFHVLECCRGAECYGGIEHFVYASSSSVYGTNQKIPYAVGDRVDEPVSLYAATKKSDELLAHAYAKLYDIPTTGLRFFTVYGEQGRPDMAYFRFSDQLQRGERIQLFNYGNCQRDFTYIEDITEGMCKAILHAPERKQGADGLPIAPYMLYNIGNSSPERLEDFVRILAEELIAVGVLPTDFVLDNHIDRVPMQAGDVPITYADISALERDFAFKPSTSLRDGLRAFAKWYKGYRG